MKLEHEYIRVPANHHRPNSRLLRLGGLLILMMLISLVSCGLYGMRPQAPDGDSGIVCWEDEPCWDCSTMGNMQCGVDRYFIVDETNLEVP